MRDELADAWKELDADPAVRVIVHTGEGRAFQTGVDVTEIASDGVGMERYRQSVEDWDLHFTSWHQQVWKPVITAVNGICAGGAFHWVADADIVIAASDAQFFDPHVTVGQVVSIEAIGLIRKMPAEAVMRMAFVGRHERMTAQRAYELGMISQIVDPPERLREEAQELAEKIAKNSPAAMAATKRALWGALESGLTDACRAGAAELVSMWGHPDQAEGPRRLRREAGGGVDGVTTLGDLLFAGDDDDASLLLHTAGQDHSLAEVRERATAIGVGAGRCRRRGRHADRRDAPRCRGRPRAVRRVAPRRGVRAAQPPPGRHPTWPTSSTPSNPP